MRDCGGLLACARRHVRTFGEVTTPGRVHVTVEATGRR